MKNIGHFFVRGEKHLILMICYDNVHCLLNSDVTIDKAINLPHKISL